MKTTKRWVVAGMAFTLFACESQPVNDAEMSPTLTEEVLTKVTKGIVIRAGQCTTEAFKAGAEHEDNGYITGLSVNCTTATNNIDDYKSYLSGIKQYNHFCVAKWPKLDTANITVKPDPVKGNKYHCLLSGKVAPAVAKFSPKE